MIESPSTFIAVPSIHMNMLLLVVRHPRSKQSRYHNSSLSVANLSKLTSTWTAVEAFILKVQYEKVVCNLIHTAYNLLPSNIYD